MDKSKNVGELSPSRRRLLRAMLSEQGIEVVSAREIPRRPEGGPAPLSFAQQRLWFADQFQPNSPSYNIPVSVRLGAVDLAALTGALQGLVERHEVLRTRFVVEGDRPMQIVDPPSPIELPVVDLRGLPGAERDAEIARHGRDEARRPFDVAGGPHFRVKLLQLGPADHLLLLTLHHIIADGWSTGIFIEELTALYDAHIRHTPPSLPELDVQYADFARWQRDQLSGEVVAGYLRYWTEQLSGAPALLELPTDRPRPAVQSFQGDLKRLSVPAPLVEALRVIAKQEGATIFMVLLAAFKLLLHRYARQDDIVVGTPIANRTHPQLEKLIGPFANTLSLRTHLSGDMTFRELVRRVREVTLGAYAHQDLPFEKLVEELRPERNLSYSPIFQVLFVLQNAPGSSSDDAPSDDQSPVLDVDTGTAKFDLTMSLAESGGGLAGILEYDRVLFDADRIERAIGHYKVVLQAVAENPDDRLWRIPMLTEAERRQLTVEWNDTAHLYCDDQCIQHLFEAQVERTPDAPALEFLDRQLSYRELNARANQLAHHLKSIGVGPEVRVGICMERSLDVIVAVLGVLKAGGVHTPLDPGYPRERLAFMLGDARIQVVLTQQRLESVLPAHGLPTILLEQEGDRLALLSRANPPIETFPDNLAYVVYTSGSTGRPKGIAMRHRTMVNLLPWQLRRFRPGTGIRTVQFTSFSFDVSVQEILNTLCFDSGVLVMMPEELRRDPAQIARFLIDKRIQRLFLPFTALHLLAEAFEAIAAYPSDLQEIVSTGEQMRLTQPIRRALARVPGIALHNQYGPSETHFATGYALTGDPDQWPTLPSIGRPLDNTRIYVLDDHFQLVPIGVPGEVYIGGVPIARGYLDRPGQNAEKFLPEAFGPPGERVYRTGDMAYYRSDGNLEYIARRDHQVKVRGYRIELGEIEAVLVGHPASQSAVVITKDDATGHKIIAAYVIPEDGAELTVAEIRRFLKDKLPEYMIPSVIAISRDLPRSPNGKIDRLALSRAKDVKPETDAAFVAPRTAIEHELVAIWQQILGVNQIGIHDNFFNLGGHSLLATRVASHIRATLGVELPLRRLFEATTIAELAAAVAEERARQPNGDAETMALLQELERLSDDEARALLAAEPSSLGESR